MIQGLRGLYDKGIRTVGMPLRRPWARNVGRIRTSAKYGLPSGNCIGFVFGSRDCWRDDPPLRIVRSVRIGAALVFLFVQSVILAACGAIIIDCVLGSVYWLLGRLLD
jgi:hypothetical protein